MNSRRVPSAVRSFRCAAVLFSLVGVVACEGVLSGGAAEFELFVVPHGEEVPGVAGSLDVVLSVRLEGSSGFPVEISHGQREVTLDLSQPTPEELGTTSVFSGIYQGVTVRFMGVEAAIVEDGPEEGASAVRVDFGGEAHLTRSSSSQVLARDGERLTVTVDLGATEWLAAAEGPSEDRVVPAQAFLDAVRITVSAR